MPSAIRLSGTLPTSVDTNPNLGNSDTVVPSQAAVKDYIDNLTLSTRLTDQIPASTSKVIDTVPIVDAKSIKWELLIVDSFTLQNYRQQIISVHNASSVNHTIYGELDSGNEIDFGVDVQIQGSDIALLVINNETHYLNSTLIRVILV